MLHGISTPYLSLGRLAHALVRLGCRVLLLDLFGRGYSDSPDLPHDSRLYSTEILIAITSSLPSCLDTRRIQYCRVFPWRRYRSRLHHRLPTMVPSLVLLAPSGLIRSSHFDWISRLMYSDYVPTWMLELAVYRRLRGGPIRPQVAKTGDEKNPTTGAEVKGN
jgi:hypothetical protein